MKNFVVLLCLVSGFSLAGCSKNKENKSLPVHIYTSPTHGFSVTAPDDPVVYSSLYRFFSDKSGKVLLLEVTVTPILPAYANQTPDWNLEVYERAYKGERGAIVGVQPVTLQGAPGREFDITAGPRAPHRTRVYIANKTYYLVEFNPTVPGAVDVANSFQFEFPVM